MLKKKIKIMYLMDYYYGTNGGTEGQLFELIRGLDKDKFQPHLFVFRPTEFIKKDNDFPCPITVLNINKLSTIDTFIKLSKLSRLIKKQHFNITHIFFNDASLIAPFFCKLSGAKVIVSRRDMGFWYTSLNQKVHKVSNRFVDFIIANSSAVARNVNRFEKYPLQKIKVVYNGHNPLKFLDSPMVQFRERTGIGEYDPIIGMVASLYKIKRQSDLIQAFSIVHKEHKNSHLVLIGSGAMETALKSLTNSLGLQDFAHFLGSVTDVIPIIKHFSVGVLCSESEGFSNAILEYMACGIPAVCTNVGGNPEIVKDGYNGFLVNVGDVKQMADRIDKILSNKSLAEMLGNNARLAVNERFTSENMVNSHMSLYNQLIFN